MSLVFPPTITTAAELMALRSREVVARKTVPEAGTINANDGDDDDQHHP